MDSKELVKRIYLVTKDFPNEDNINEDNYQIIRKEIEKISNKPNALRSTQLNS